MTTQTKALKLALEALEKLTGAAEGFSVSGVYFNEELQNRKCLDDAYDAMGFAEEALAQPDQGPVACTECERLRDALKRANGLAEHFERAWYLQGDEIERLKAQPEQEPVAIPDCGESGHADGACGNRECLPIFRRNTTPPHCKPLTDEMVVAAARVLNERQADACGVDRDDQWAIYSDDFKADALAMLKAAHNIKEKNT